MDISSRTRHLAKQPDRSSNMTQEDFFHQNEHLMKNITCSASKIQQVRRHFYFIFFKCSRNTSNTSWLGLSNYISWLGIEIKTVCLTIPIPSLDDIFIHHMFSHIVSIQKLIYYKAKPRIYNQDFKIYKLHLFD